MGHTVARLRGCRCPRRSSRPIIVIGSGRPGPLRQFTVLTRRTGDTLVRNRLTLAILLGSPALVVAMFAVLFRPGAFVFAHPNPSAVIMIVFWIAFGGFFFGLTYGLLQICTEMPIVRRERLVGLRLGPYLMSKVAVLLPFLLLVDLLMLGVLRALDRLPALDWPTFASLAVTLLLDAVAALTLGLLTSAAVTNPAQATLALPLLCFPAVWASPRFVEGSGLMVKPLIRGTVMPSDRSEGVCGELRGWFHAGLVLSARRSARICS